MTKKSIAYVPRLKEHYENTIRKDLLASGRYSNAMQLPKLAKIVLNIGVGEAVKDTKTVKAAQEDLSLIAGQKAVITKAKKSIAGFKVREGMPLGTKVTLRGDVMYDFLDRLITIAFPRARDFQGLSINSVDRSGNYALGIKEHIIFPEIDYDKVVNVWGLDVVICTTAGEKNDAIDLLKRFNMPFMNYNGEV